MQKTPSKSRFAFECSSKDIRPNRKGHIYLWTFTFAEVVEIAQARKYWIAFLKKFRERKMHKFFQGLRVFEMHPGGHGLHIHVITANFLRVNEVRALWHEFGGGRINVKPIPWERRNYLAKYLSKSGRPQCLKGVRLWAAFGGFDHTRVKDVVVESDFTRTYKLLCSAIEGFDKLRYNFRVQAVNNVLMGYRWYRGFGGIEFDPDTNEPFDFEGVVFRRTAVSLPEPELF